MDRVERLAAILRRDGRNSTEGAITSTFIAFGHRVEKGGQEK